MTKKEQIEKIAFVVALTYYTGWTDCKLGAKERKKRSDIIVAIADKDYERFIPHAKQLLNCIMPEKQTNKPFTNAILELEI
jgi:hypothetical protein